MQRTLLLQTPPEECPRALLLETRQTQPSPGIRIGRIKRISRLPAISCKFPPNHPFLIPEPENRNTYIYNPWRRRSLEWLGLEFVAKLRRIYTVRSGISFSGSFDPTNRIQRKREREKRSKEGIATMVRVFISSRWIFVARIGACRPIEMHGTSLRFQHGEKFLNGRPVAAQECMEMLRTTSVLYCPTWWLVAG